LVEIPGGFDMKVVFTASLVLIAGFGIAHGAALTELPLRGSPLRGSGLTQACAAEINQYCRTIAAVGRAGCLQGVSANLSAACRTAVQQALQQATQQGNTSGVGATTPTGGAATTAGQRGGDDY
jgi:hypothetical protein